ncbi:methylated-DNA--[protein]-cysteine S-methyltransferase [Brevibacillus dissolubilis]|uniref:methylated-DNA--[protein]-cysteine S-methyltransferase n=1 Tax=Brevibacillus dissolubilis TaxID=1844116 RepID=UPI00111717EE|nr:methylated-DNA--[protein]-cysteine S-methyltransferase [Brevibacillus dissolubilis]
MTSRTTLPTHTAYYHSLIGWLMVIGTADAIISVRFIEEEPPTAEVNMNLPSLLHTCLNQLHEYFCGGRHSFTLPLQLGGTAFQQQVWHSVQAIPVGKTQTYRDIATTIGNDRAVRAVGTANGRNQLALLIPCHRVIGTDSTLRGYAWGLWRKEWLLAHETEKASSGSSH